MAEQDSVNNHDTPGYWRSLRELSGDREIDEIKAHEFMAGVTDQFDPSTMSPMSRKRFLALLTASAAFAAAGCSAYRDKGEIVPYTRKPEEITPGVPNHYASTCTGCSQHCGILIKTREGRPIKVDGNPDHPVNRGTICATGQASILNLYDPQRLRKPAYGFASGKSGELSWDLADHDVRRALDDASRAGKEIALISNPVVSPSVEKVLALFVSRYPTAKYYSYELFNDANRRTAWTQCFGSPGYPSIAWEKANVVLALESDFLGAEGSSVENIRRYASRRDLVNGREISRLYCVEGAMSLTGANADYRMRLRPDYVLNFVVSLLHELSVVRRAIEVDPEVRSIVADHPLKPFAAQNGLSSSHLNHLVNDLIAQRGAAIIHAGDTLPRDVHIAVNYLNHLLGNDPVYDFHHVHRAETRFSSPQEINDLVGRMNHGDVGVAIHVQTNPVYQLPRVFRYNEAIQKVPTTISLTQFEDETSQHCAYVLPVHNAFEAWGDFASRSGLVSFQQPVISPLYATRQAEAILLFWAGNPSGFQEKLYYEFLKDFWEKEMYPALHVKAEFPSFWNSALHDGVITTLQEPAGLPNLKTEAVRGIVPQPPIGDFAIALRTNYYIGDGRFANNGWLQEIPHPVSKIVWDNYAAVSTKTAAALGIDSGDILNISLQRSAQNFPVFVQPGMADGLVTVELGYGRWNAGSVGTGVGTDASVFLSADALLGGRISTGAKLLRTEGHHDLVSTQEHHSLDDTLLKDLHITRKIIQEGTLAEYQKDAGFLHHHDPELPSITRGVEYHGVKWAMSIDLNKCVGCNACVAGCNVENNIPVIGKEQVQKGRVMHWIRIDRYYSGTSDNPSLSHQPMLCQHCDNAPCENVCPVAATNHSPDGLNQMVYNRCVGTKYCSNNCPYKVRRFNFLNFRDNYADGYYLQEPVSLLENPEVTVRSRGVMEKCTFCIQRIAEARQHASEQGRPLSGRDVKTACQEACPAQAIVFGDMNDPASEVSKYRGHPLGYHVLEEVNARPNVTYIARLRNIHPET